MRSAVFGEDRLKEKALSVINARTVRKESRSGRTVRSAVIGTVVKRGFPFEAGNHVKEALGLSDREIAETLGTSEKTLQRMRKRKEPFSMVESDRLYRMARIFALASHVMEGDDLARQWLHTPQYGLGEEIPMEVMKTEDGAREVEELLYRIEHGTLA